ncbi:hypothetical protein A6R68_15457, partial [Neotoma lepida]
ALHLTLLSPLPPNRSAHTHTPIAPGLPLLGPLVALDRGECVDSKEPRAGEHAFSLLGGDLLQ